MTKNHNNNSAASRKIAYKMEKEVKKNNKQIKIQKNEEQKENTENSFNELQTLI